MKHYLSFGGGVNSVALHLLMIQERIDFEAIFVNHGGDWPETYEYLTLFQNWLKTNGYRNITVLTPDVNTIEKKRFNNIYDYYAHKCSFPMRASRACTDRFKIRVVNKYIKKPCFMYLGIDNGETQRAKIGVSKGIENRYLLIEYEIDRSACKQIIHDANLPIPMKSGCFFCPFQGKAQFKELRNVHPELFCKSEKLEESYNKRRNLEQKKPLYIKDIPLRALINEDQLVLFEEEQYPPCSCSL